MGRQYLLTGRTVGSARVRTVFRSLCTFAFGLLFLWLFIPYDEVLVSLSGPIPISSYSSSIWLNCEADKVLDGSSTPTAGLAVVIPLVSTQWIRVRDQLLSWRVYPPCEDSTPVDLYYYFDLPLDSPEVSSTLSQLQHLLAATPNRVLNCFRSIRFFSANLTREETTNSYSLNLVRTHYKTEGTVAQFYKLMLEDTILKKEGYRYLFYMEPDTRPVQPNWVSALLADSSLSSARYWIRGSIIRYGKPLLVSSLPYRHLYLHHINGNAFYRLDDVCFHNYLRLVREEYDGFAFDLAIHYHRHSARHYLLHQYLAHRWEYTDVIADLSYWPVPENLPKSTKLIHGLSLVEKSREWEEDIINGHSEKEKENDRESQVILKGRKSTKENEDEEGLGLEVD